MQPHEKKLMLQLMTQSGFFLRFFEFCGTSDSSCEAFEKVETEYKRFFEVSKYSSFKSFQSALNRHNRKLLGK